MVREGAIALASLTAGTLLLHPRLAGNRLWRATITPLASIIGSGFLVLGPILKASYGDAAPLVMLGLCLGAYAFGGAIRFNIRAIASGDPRPRAEARLETLASWSLAFSYVISVAYYLNLFGAFGVSLTRFDDPLHARLLTSVMLLLILAIGVARGFRALERLEQLAVGLKLAVIAGLLVGLGAYFFAQAADHALSFSPPALSISASITLAFGLIVTVQGFETARYLGEAYPPETRITSMRLAQGISTLIYMIYIGLLAYAFEPQPGHLTETAIIGMMRVISAILPGMLVAAALSAQLSAAIADTSGAGGLITELTRGRVTARHGYALLVGAGVVLTWSANVFEIIAYASRAFAFYYALQAAIAALSAHRTGSRSKATGFGALALLGLLIAVLGQPVE
jgi:hypothetical protein